MLFKAQVSTQLKMKKIIQDCTHRIYHVISIIFTAKEKVLKVTD